MSKGHVTRDDVINIVLVLKREFLIQPHWILFLNFVITLGIRRYFSSYENTGILHTLMKIPYVYSSSISIDSQ